MRLLRSVVSAAALAMALTALPAGSAGEPPRPPASALNRLRDLGATVKARRLLQDDPALARLNLGVEVTGGVATVWGPVPSLAVGHVAAMKLEGISGIDKVRSSFYLEEVKDPILELARPEAAPERVAVAKPRDEAVKVSRPAGDGPVLQGPRPAKPPSPSEQAARLQQSEPRFRGVGVEVNGGTVTVRRGDVAGRDVMDLVAKLRRIPGVKDVILTGD